MRRTCSIVACWQIGLAQRGLLLIHFHVDMFDAREAIHLEKADQWCGAFRATTAPPSRGSICASPPLGRYGHVMLLEAFSNFKCIGVSCRKLFACEPAMMHA